MAQQFKHNRKRNTGLLYEFLVRQVSKSMIEKDNKSYNTALEIMRKYFSDGCPLAEQRELFDVIKNTRNVTESVARRILGEVQRESAKQDHKRIDIKKSNIIKEINYAFGQNFFSEHRVPEYRLLASIQMVIDNSQGTPVLTESVANIQLEEGIIQYMMTKGGYSVKQQSKSEVDNLVMQMVAKRFDEKYAKNLNKAQKLLLEKYVKYQVSGDVKQVAEAVLSEMKRIDKVLSEARSMSEIIADTAMYNKLEEAHRRLLAPGSLSLDEQVEDVMLYQKLVEEIESDE